MKPSPQSEPATEAGSIRCIGVRKRYEERSVLAGINLSFSPRTITALLGENGAGKSTLVGILAGSIRPSEGEVRFVEKEGAKGAPLERRQVGLIAHATMLYGDLSARENLRFYARLYGCSEEMVEEVIARCGLSPYADRRTGTYSRGMAQRTAIARAILHRPRLLLCDEPYTGLDPAGSEVLSRILKECRDGGAIVILVTHDLEVAAQLSDRAVVLRRGRVVADLPAPFDAAGLRGLLEGRSPA